jgi:nucleotide-binding universal stress UspA family protein
MYKRIVVPLDGSDLSMQVMPYACLVAKSTGARITLLEVLEPVEQPTAAAAVGAGVVGAALEQARTSAPEHWEALRAGLTREALGSLNAVAAPLRQDGIDVDVTVVEGDAASTIVFASEREPDTLIAMSTHGRSGIGRWVIGSVTDKVVRHAKVPSLVVRSRVREISPADQNLKGVVLPLDGSELSELAIPHAVTMAKALGLGVTILRSVSPSAYGFGYADYYAPQVYADVTADVDADVRGYLAILAERLRKLGVGYADTHAAGGYPGDAIVDEVGTGGAKMVVMSSHGRGGVGRWVLGSVADRVVTHSTGPVLVVPAHNTA